MTAADLPASENPDNGFVHSANELNIPESWNHSTKPLGFEWFEDGRADRIAQVIGAGGASNIASNRVLQTDTFSALSLRLIALLLDGKPSLARYILRAWNGHSDAGSAAALLFELWLSSHLRPALLARIAPDFDLRKFLMPGNIPTVVRLLEGVHPSLIARVGLNTVGLRHESVSETLQSAWCDVCDRFGDDPNTWHWSDLHKGWFDHALTLLGCDFDVGPLAKSGNSTSVMLAHYDASDYRVRVGASVRMVVDVGEWNNSVWINAPGQSGIPESPHYDDFAALWAIGDYVPMLYSKDAVCRATQCRLELHPG